ncbi:Uncharacterised protein [Enterobacter cloacae]|nr:Uncharacterised protein [Enterobacter cloacae]
MPGLCRLNGNFCRFAVTNFTYHNDVRILPEQGAQHALEGQPRTRINLRLV